MKHQEELINYIADIADIPKKDITLQLQVYNSGIISSLKLLELMTFIEKQFNITIKPEELVVDNFKDIQSILDFIKKKQTLPLSTAKNGLGI